MVRRIVLGLLMLLGCSVGCQTSAAKKPNVAPDNQQATVPATKKPRFEFLTSRAPTAGSNIPFYFPTPAEIRSGENSSSSMMGSGFDQ
jgi:hypothetical protein